MNLHKVGVLGAGNIGTGVATDLVLHGIVAVVLDVSKEILERAERDILKNVRFAPLLSKSAIRVSKEDALKRLQFTTNFGDLPSCEFIIENVTEDWNLKKPVYENLDRVMPPEHGRRLAGLLPHAQLIEIDDSYALIPLDQPARPAQLIADFTPAPGSTARATPGDSALPASKQTRRFSGWLLGGYLPLIWQPEDAHRSARSGSAAQHLCRSKIGAITAATCALGVDVIDHAV